MRDIKNHNLAICIFINQDDGINLVCAATLFLHAFFFTLQKTAKNDLGAWQYMYAMIYIYCQVFKEFTYVFLWVGSPLFLVACGSQSYKTLQKLLLLISPVVTLHRVLNIH